MDEQDVYNRIYDTLETVVGRNDASLMYKEVERLALRYFLKLTLAGEPVESSLDKVNRYVVQLGEDIKYRKS